MPEYFGKYTQSEVTNTRRIINTPDDFAKNNLFYVQEAGYLQSLKPHESRRRGLDSYLFIVIMSGSGHVMYNGELRRVSAPCCVFLDCRREYSHISSENDPWELMWIHFNGPHAGFYYEYLTERHGNIFHVPDTASISDAIRHIIELNEVRTPDSPLITSRIITDLLTDAIASYSPDRENDSRPANAKLSAIMGYIDEHFTEKLSLDDIASRFYISKYYLSHAFKKEFKITVIQYILMKRISLAKEKLRYTSDSIETIAGECGLGDASYFNRIFKKTEGVTASRYRSAWKGKSRSDTRQLQ